MSKTSNKQKVEALYAWLNWIKKFSLILIIPFIFSCKTIPVPINAGIKTPTVTWKQSEFCIETTAFATADLNTVIKTLKEGVTMHFDGLDVNLRSDSIGHAQLWVKYCYQTK